MRIKEVSVGKELKLSLPKFSNITAKCYLTIELEENEQIDWDTIWDLINQQVWLQLNHIEPTWILDEKSKEWAKVTVKKLLKRK